MIYIESPHKLQRKLLADFLNKHTGLPCYESPSQYHFEKSTTLKANTAALVLWDYYGRSNELSSLSALINTARHYSFSKIYTAAFNIPKLANIENDYIKQGLHGLFYEDDALDLLAKGVQAILRGELWFSRATLSKTVTEILPSYSKTIDTSQGLTQREKEVLLEISNGLSNVEIAEKFFLSEFTVKTHIQNIYKKINVTKRSQATNWAFNHFFHLSFRKE